MRSIASYLRIIGFSLFGYLLINYAGTTGEVSIFDEYPLLWAVLAAIVLFYIAVEVSIGSIEKVLYRNLSPEAQARYDEQRALAKANQFKWIKTTYKKFVGGQPIAQEDDIILDHNYDGIQELDNNLPPWWVYGFYITIIFAGIYLARFEVFKEYNQEQEYEAALAQAQLEIEEYKRTAKNLVDVNTVVLLTDESDLTAGKQIFETHCVACHKATGAGGIGPNLTDAYWILGGGIKNVFKTISEGGRPGKGMVAWKATLKPSEMAQVASYVLGLQGTQPADGKEPEGELWSNPETALQ